MRKKRFLLLQVLFALLLIAIQTQAQGGCIDPITGAPSTDCNQDAPDYSKTWDVNHAEEYINNPGSDLSVIKDPAELNKAFDLLSSKGRLGELSVDQINGLSKENIFKISDSEALKKINKDTIQNANAEHLKNVASELRPDQINGLTNTQLRILLPSLPPENWHETNQEELSKTLTNVAGYPVSIFLGNDGIGGSLVPGGFTIQRANLLQVDTSILTAGTNISFIDGKLTALSADSFIQGTTIATAIQNIDDDGRAFRVESAEHLQSDCLVLNKIKDTTFQTGTALYLQSHSDSSPSLTDCAGLQSTVTLRPGSELRVTKDATKPLYVATNLSLDFFLDMPLGQVDENVSIDGIALLNLTSIFGLKNLQGVGDITYTYLSTPEQTWQFKGTQGVFTLQTRKDRSHTFMPCEECAQFDLIDHKIETFGNVEVLKQPMRDGALLSTAFLPVLNQEHTAAHTLFTLNDELSVVEIARIIIDAPTITTSPSTYFDLVELFYEGATTRFLKIKTNIPFSDSLVNIYETMYSTATTTIKENAMEYQHDTCTIHLFKPTEADTLITLMHDWGTS